MLLIEVFIIDNRYSSFINYYIFEMWCALLAIVPSRILPTCNDKQNITLQIALSSNRTSINNQHACCDARPGLEWKVSPSFNLFKVSSIDVD